MTTGVAAVSVLGLITAVFLVVTYYNTNISGMLSKSNSNSLQLQLLDNAPSNCSLRYGGKDRPMTVGDDEVLSSILTKNSIFLEWGSGGSTKKYPYTTKRTFSIELSPSWCTDMMNSHVVKCLIYQGRLLYLCMPALAPLKMFSRLANISDAHMFSGYINAPVHIKSEWDVETYDVVFVDGRFRVACALTAYNYLSADSYLVVGDFVDRNYRDILDYYDWVNTSSKAAVFKKIEGKKVDPKLLAKYVLIDE